MLHSITGLTVRNLAALSSRELSIPQSIPMKTEKNARAKKLPSTFQGVDDVNSLFGPAYS
jgi:hypothetical protein